MLPLIRLKVDTTGVSETFNPIRFGQEFQGRIANPRDVLVFHRAKRAANRSAKVELNQPELSIDDPDLTVSEKLEKVRVETLVKEFMGAQVLQLLGGGGMSEAIQKFVEKDDIHAIQRYFFSFVSLSFLDMEFMRVLDSHVKETLNDMVGGVQKQGKEVEIDEENIDELVRSLFFS